MDGGKQAATDSKTVVGVSSTVGSNPILSATLPDNGLLPGRPLLFSRGLRYNCLAGFDPSFDPSCYDNALDLDRLPIDRGRPY